MRNSIVKYHLRGLVSQVVLYLGGKEREAGWGGGEFDSRPQQLILPPLSVRLRDPPVSPWDRPVSSVRGTRWSATIPACEVNLGPTCQPAWPVDRPGRGTRVSGRTGPTRGTRVSGQTGPTRGTRVSGQTGPTRETRVSGQTYRWDPYVRLIWRNSSVSAAT
jgi:hypothetical protein